MLPTTSSCLVTPAAIGHLARFCWGSWTPVKNGAALFLFPRALVVPLPPDGSLAYCGDLHVQFLFRPHPLLLPAPTTSVGDLWRCAAWGGEKRM